MSEERQSVEQKKYIKFIDSDYKVLFHIPDGGRIRITRSDGEQLDRVCRYIDEYHTIIGNYRYHICEFAERMEQAGSTYQPLDYIKEAEFYPRRYLSVPPAGKALPYYILDQTSTHCFAYAPKGPKGKRYCIFERVPDGRTNFHVGKIVQWSGSLRDIRPQDWGFNVEKIKAVAQRSKVRSQPER